MAAITCGRCGFVEPPRFHYGSRVCRDQRFIASMEGRDFVRIPARRWTRALERAGAPVVHGPVSVTRTGAWVPRVYLESLKAHRGSDEFRTLPFHLQVEAVVWRVKRGARLMLPAPG